MRRREGLSPTRRNYRGAGARWFLPGCGAEPRIKQIQENKMKKLVLAATLIAVLSVSAFAAGRDYISVVGSSTVYPFTTVAAENFGKKTGFKTPKIESTGTGGGFKLFVAGVGVDTPDMVNASRAIKASEFATAQQNGVSEIVEVKLGYDGIVVANSIKGQLLNLSPRDLFLALAKVVPNPNGSETLVDNPYKTWQDVNAALPAVKIEVLGPPPTSGTRDAFVELVMQPGAKEFAWVKALEKSDAGKFKALSNGIREDGAFVDAGENDNLIVQKLAANPAAFGIFGYSYLEQNLDKIQGSLINGVAPVFETIADGSYIISRPLFVYVKKAHVANISGLKEFLLELTSEAAWGDEGYMADKGLIPMSAVERAKVRNIVENLTVITEVE